MVMTRSVGASTDVSDDVSVASVALAVAWRGIAGWIGRRAPAGMQAPRRGTATCTGAGRG